MTLGDLSAANRLSGSTVSGRKRLRYARILIIAISPFCAGTAQAAGQPATSESSRRDLPVLRTTEANTELTGRQSANVKAADVLLPGHKTRTLVRFKVVRGRAIFQGDIDLGPADRLENPVGQYRSSRRQTGIGSISQPLSVRVGDEYLWPGGLVPFDFDSNLLTPANQSLLNQIVMAIDFWNNSTNLQIVQGSVGGAFIRFTEDLGIGGSGQSKVGRRSNATGGPQLIKLKSTANRSTICPSSE